MIKGKITKIAIPENGQNNVYTIQDRNALSLQGGVINGDLEVKGNIKNNGVGVALLDSPVFTGIPTSVTANLDNNSDQIATTSFVQNLFAQEMQKIENELSKI